MQEIEIVDKMLDRLFGESFIMASELHAWQKIKELVQLSLNKQSTPLPECVVCGASKVMLDENGLCGLCAK